MHTAIELPTVDMREGPHSAAFARYHSKDVRKDAHHPELIQICKLIYAGKYMGAC